MENQNNLMNYKIPQDLLTTVPAKVAKHYTVLPLERRNGTLKLLAPKEMGKSLKEELRVLLGRELEFESCDPEELGKLIHEHYGIGASVIETLTRGREKKDIVSATQSADPSSGGDFERIDGEGEDATVIRLVNDILLDAIRHKASDIHIEPFEDSLRVRYRVDGILIKAKVSEKIKHLSSTLLSRIKIMASLDIGEKRLPQDGRIKVRQKSGELDLRVSVLPSGYGEAIVIRILKSLELLTLEELGFDSNTLTAFRKQLRKPHGMILVTGPTGSGKTTTLYASLKELNTIDRKIITIEDPVEYKLKGIIQMQVHEKIGFSFAKALRSVLRHDPDSIMVGEIRDRETAEIAVRSALTGHLVFSTLHTNDASSAVTRLVEMGIEPYLVASSVEAVLAQRLVRKLDDQDRLKGRTVIYELMAMSDGIRELITNRRSASEIRQLALAEGMIDLATTGKSKVTAGMTTLDEISRIVST